ncbi:MAG TPA: FGGY-family carbohydrate kinase [Acidobacteriaceae bacterium]|nr:FGGY-family carbohydrate kinase [Acidobacteriaceae bacterium]
MTQAMVAIDLGAESCRVSLLRWAGDAPKIRMVHRFANGPVADGASLRWDLERICVELERGLRLCADAAPEGVASLGVTGWGVDYVRLDPAGKPIAQPHCYRDARHLRAMDRVHAMIPAADLYARTGVQVQALNTIYQLYADGIDGVAEAPWVQLPEYILHWLGAPRVAEWTNATHTALVDPETRQWDDELFARLGLDRGVAPELVRPGTEIGRLRGDLARLPAFAHTRLIAPACHDTASAVAGIPGGARPWAYISSGTWSLVGATIRKTIRTLEAFAHGFTNLGAADGAILFHRGVAGMWLLDQCIRTWRSEHAWSAGELVAEAQKLPAPDAPLDLDDPALVAPGDMPSRIAAQRERRGLAGIPVSAEAAPAMANLIFHSLACCYGDTLRAVERLTGQRAERICIVGGGSRNAYLNALTEAATGIPVTAFSAESSTIGNFAVQAATIEGGTVAENARRLGSVEIQS